MSCRPTSRRGRDIGDIEELVRLGVEAGLSEREARAAVVLREGQDGIVAAERHATVLGITGVPAFIFDRQYSVSGAQEVEAFVRVIDQVVSSPPAPNWRRDARRAHRPRARPHRGARCSAVRAARAGERSLHQTARRRRTGGIRSGSAKCLSRFRSPAQNLEREVQRRGAGQRRVGRPSLRSP